MKKGEPIHETVVRTAVETGLNLISGTINTILGTTNSSSSKGSTSNKR